MLDRRVTITSSVRVVRSRAESVSEVTASEMMGSALGSNRRIVGVSALSGRLASIWEILSRTSCAAVSEETSRSKIIRTMAEPDMAVDWMVSSPAIVFTWFSMGSMMSLSTASGEAPG